MLNAHNIIAFVPTTNAQALPANCLTRLPELKLRQMLTTSASGANQNMLRVVKLKEFTPAQFTILGWEVSDAQQAVSELQSRGVQFKRYPWAQQDELGIWSAPAAPRSPGSKTRTATSCLFRNTSSLWRVWADRPPSRILAV